MKTKERIRKKGLKLEVQEVSWMFYDWANSVYATNIMAAIFPIYFAAVAKNAGQSGDQLWGYGTSLATLIVAVLAPLLGAVADFRGMKKKLLAVFIFLGASFTLLMAVTDNWKLMLVGYVVSYIGFTGANLFYDSFLTDVTTKERMDAVSSGGFALGYIGGSTIAFIISIIFMMFFGMDNPIGVKIAVVITALWWAGFSIPILLNVKQKHYVLVDKKGYIKSAFSNIAHTFRSLIKNRALLIFILAYFFYIDGVNTVIHMATVYGSTIGLNTTLMIVALLVTQIVAVPCTLLFSLFAKKVGSLRMIFAAVIMYVFICVVGFYMGYSIESVPESSADYASALHRSQVLFFTMAFLVGTVQGGIQALSRSYFGKMIPPERSNEYYGFFDIFGKFAAVLGPFLYAFVSSKTGSSASGIAGVSILFMVALGILYFGRKCLKEAPGNFL
ncbi:MAG: MFS transporter [Clostridiaceae bacterium]|nr:MFS transporter [Clostridiaceae bacterium]